ncbi:MAG: hypothetical protein ACYCUG_18155 [Acidimicrobiales bacterium]
MPAETHQQGRTTDAESVIEFLRFLLNDQRDGADEGATLSGLGVDAGNIAALWDAVREELAERALGPEIDPSDLDPSMTLVAAAKAMASMLEAVGDDR